MHYLFFKVFKNTFFKVHPVLYEIENRIYLWFTAVPLQIRIEYQITPAMNIFCVFFFFCFAWNSIHNIHNNYQWQQEFNLKSDKISIQSNLSCCITGILFLYSNKIVVFKKTLILKLKKKHTYMHQFIEVDFIYK